MEGRGQDQELLEAYGQPERWDAYWQKATRRAAALQACGHHQPFEWADGAPRATVIQEATEAFQAPSERRKVW